MVSDSADDDIRTSQRYAFFGVPQIFNSEADVSERVSSDCRHSLIDISCGTTHIRNDVSSQSHVAGRYRPRSHPTQPQCSRRVHQTPLRRQVQWSPRNHHERHLVLQFMRNWFSMTFVADNQRYEKNNGTTIRQGYRGSEKVAYWEKHLNLTDFL